jgi:hypothetical protein
MGNYVLQKAMAAAWTRKNQPLLASLLNQLITVAADVDNDLFDAGAPDSSDGAAIVNLSYRVTSLYSGRDAVLGASAGLKHFGTRRLGRSGLAHRPPLVTGPPATDNVWDVDCSSFFPPSVPSMDIHGAYFVTAATINLMRQIFVESIAMCWTNLVSLKARRGQLESMLKSIQRPENRVSTN